MYCYLPRFTSSHGQNVVDSRDAADTSPTNGECATKTKRTRLRNGTWVRLWHRPGLGTSRRKCSGLWRYYPRIQTGHWCFRVNLEWPLPGEKNTETGGENASANDLPNLRVAQSEKCDSLVFHTTCGTNVAMEIAMRLYNVLLHLQGVIAVPVCGTIRPLLYWMS